jgi:hypothetical protein
MCEICNNRFNECPCCSKDNEYIICEECNGVGYFYYDEQGNDYEEYDETLIKDYCYSCYGEGKILIEY